jgi:hypothetical protein
MREIAVRLRITGVLSHAKHLDEDLFCRCNRGQEEHDKEQANRGHAGITSTKFVDVNALQAGCFR